MKFKRFLPWGLILIGVIMTVAAFTVGSCVDIDEALPHYKHFNAKADPDVDCAGPIWLP